MKRIFKYDIGQPGEATTIRMPGGAVRLSVGVQDQSFFVWALVDPEAATDPVTFRIVGTGWNLDDDFADQHIYGGMVQSGAFVWHVWEQLCGECG